MTFLNNSLLNNFRGIIWDLDGTLVDSGPAVSLILNDLRVGLGRSALPQSNYYEWISLGGKDLVVSALNICEEDSDIYLSKFRERYLEVCTPPDTVYPNVAFTLACLKRRGIRLSICTNKPRRFVDKVLRETALAGYFNYVLAGDDLSTRKPAIENVNRCLDAMNTQPEVTLFVGDSTVDQESARNAGVPFAFFSEGYDDGVKQNEAFFVFHDHSLLAKYVLGLV